VDDGDVRTVYLVPPLLSLSGAVDKRQTWPTAAGKQVTAATGRCSWTARQSGEQSGEQS
jgi:hypothetical protein